MRNKIVKGLKRLAVQMTIGKPPYETAKVYKRLKKARKEMKNHGG